MTTLLFEPKRKGKIGTLELDATLEEQHNYSSEVTQYPIETGESISDHINLNPVRLTMRGFITQTPIGTLSVERVATILGNDLIQTAFDKLIEIRDNKDVIDVVSGLKVYSDMIMDRLSIPRDNRTGQSLRFTAEFIQIKKTASILETGEIPTSDLSTDEHIQDIAPSNVNTGMQGLIEASAEMRDRIIGWLF